MSHPHDLNDVHQAIDSLSDQLAEMVFEDHRPRYHGTARAAFNPDGITKTIDTLLANLADGLGFSVRLVHTTIAPAGERGIAMVTVIVEEL